MKTPSKPYTLTNNQSFDQRMPLWKPVETCLVRQRKIPIRNPEPGG